VRFSINFLLSLKMNKRVFLTQTCGNQRGGNYLPILDGEGKKSIEEKKGQKMEKNIFFSQLFF
jgi:hypothetical protein